TLEPRAEGLELPAGAEEDRPLGFQLLDAAAERNGLAGRLLDLLVAAGELGFAGIGVVGEGRALDVEPLGLVRGLARLAFGLLEAGAEGLELRAGLGQLRLVPAEALGLGGEALDFLFELLDLAARLD